MRFWSQAKSALQPHKGINIPEVFRMVVGNKEIRDEGTVCSAAEGIVPAPSDEPEADWGSGMRVEVCPPLAPQARGEACPPSPQGRRLASPSPRASHIPLFSSWANTASASVKEG